LIHLRQENKIRKSMEIAAFKVKSCNLPMLTFCHSNLNIWSYRSPIDANLILLDSLLKEINAPNFSPKKCHMMEIWFFKDDNWILPANRFREETSPNCVPKHPNRHLSFYFSNLAPLSQILKISCKAISFCFLKNSYWST